MGGGSYFDQWLDPGAEEDSQSRSCAAEKSTSGSSQYFSEHLFIMMIASLLLPGSFRCLWSQERPRGLGGSYFDLHSNNI